MSPSTVRMDRFAFERRFLNHHDGVATVWDEEWALEEIFLRRVTYETVGKTSPDTFSDRITEP